MADTKYPEALPVRVTSKMYKQVRERAEREYITMSQWIRKVIREALEMK